MQTLGSARFRCLCLTLVWLGVTLGATHPLGAQGTTGAAVQGTVISTDGDPLSEATVLVTKLSNGERWQATTGASGRYFLDHLSVGGPYGILVRAVGYQPVEQSGMFLSLGERLTADFRLASAAFQLQEITVSAAPDPLINAGRTGPAQTVSESTIARIPVLGRDFTQLAVLSPQVTSSPIGGASFTGQHSRLNGLQIDGATNNDLFGLTPTPYGIPALAPEALKELQVITAPFDVRYGNFAAGLVNAVTKSGTNRFEGSLFSYISSEGLTGKDSTGSRASAFHEKEFGLMLGGPIARDRVAFFINAGYRQANFPQLAPAPSSDTTGGRDSVGIGIRYTTLVRFQDILRSRYGVDPGSFLFGDGRQPTWSLFGKITAQLGVNNRLEASHNYLHSNTLGDGFRISGFYGIGGTETPAVVNATRINWTASLGRGIANELILARLHEDDQCRPGATSQFAAVSVFADAGILAAGNGGSCGLNVRAQTIWELTNNLSLEAGAHRLTFGTHNELLDLLDVFFELSGGGDWSFDSLDSLEQGLPSAYFRDLPGPLRPDGPRSEFRVHQLGFYVQDQWTVTDRLSLTGGIRFDVPFLPDEPPQNPTLLSELGINTAVSPSGNLLWSPRLGVSYDPTGRGATYLRGGIGLFAGRPAYSWLREGYIRTGLEVLRLACFGAEVPSFTLDPANQPVECSQPQNPDPVVAYFNPAFRYPRNLKIALGVDHRLPSGFVGTVDLLYTRGVDQLDLIDANLLPQSGTASGEAGRALYGTIDPADGTTQPNRRSPAFGPVIEIRNGRGDRSYSLAGQLQKRFANGTELSAAYTYTDAKDRISSPADLAYSNLGTTPLDGTWETRNLRTSHWSVPHKVTLVATVNLPLEFRLGAVYNGQSGHPFSYIVRGDANADGVDNVTGARHNDLVYVPTDASDITLADPEKYESLEAIIRDDGCLATQRGRILERNSCRNPWVNFVQARLTRVFPTTRGQTLQLTADLFNVLNFLDADWGLVRSTVEDFGFQQRGGRTSLLQVVGYDTVNDRGVYRVLQPGRRRIDLEASRWRLQLSARYVF